MALILLIMGIVLATFSIQKSYTEENTVAEWDVSTPLSTLTPLTPNNLTAWAPMQEGSFFELNVSASDTVRVRIGNVTFADTGEEVWVYLLFDQVGTRFAQKATINETGTSYLVEIKNEGTTPVHIAGNVFLKNTVVKYEAIYPYPSSATLMLLVGLTLLIYAVLTNPKKRYSKTKAKKPVATRHSAYIVTSRMVICLLKQGSMSKLIARALRII